MMLKICKRLGTKDDPKANENRNTLNRRYGDIWINRIPITDLVKKYLKTTSNLMASEKKIAYTNTRCKNVSKYIRNNLGKTDNYEVGEVLICRKYKKIGGTKFNDNYRFKIVNISGNVVTLENIKSKDRYTAGFNNEAKNRKIDETKFVNVEWLMKRLNGNCQNCGCRFELGVQNGYLTNSITCQRLNNEVPNYKNNCEAWWK